MLAKPVPSRKVKTSPCWQAGFGRQKDAPAPCSRKDSNRNPPRYKPLCTGIPIGILTGASGIIRAIPPTSSAHESGITRVISPPQKCSGARASAAAQFFLNYRPQCSSICFARPAAKLTLAETQCGKRSTFCKATHHAFRRLGPFSFRFGMAFGKKLRCTRKEKGRMQAELAT